jgi:REP element-mobilizing transposase RayT
LKNKTHVNFLAMKQLSLIQISKTHGGELLKGKRKGFRPLNSKRPLHLVLRSQAVLKHGSFHKHNRLLKSLLALYTKKYKVHVYDVAVCTNHIHLVVRFAVRGEFQNFLRVFCGQVAQRISNAKGFWLHRPFTRVLEWGRDLQKALAYVTQNELETHGIVQYQSRRGRYRGPP